MWSFADKDPGELDHYEWRMWSFADMDTGEQDSDSDDEMSKDANADSMHFDFSYRKQLSNGLPFTVHDIGQINKVCFHLSNFPTRCAQLLV